MTDTPTKQEIQSKSDNVPGAMPVEQKKNNRNDRKRNRKGDSKNLERDSDWQERVVQIRRVSKTVKGGKKMSFRAIVVVGNEKGQVGVGVGKAGDVIGAVRKGVSDGKKNLVRGKNLVVSAGYSHPVEMIPPDGITYKVESNTNVTVSGIDKEIVGNEAAKIRSIRPPEPYKGKGIKYHDERILRKAGKSGKK